MPVFKRPGAETYSYDFKRGGQRFSGSTGETNKRAAEAVVQRLKSEATEALKAARRMGSRGLTLDAAADRYWTETAAHTATPEKVAAEMRQLVLAVGPTVRLADITDAVVAGLVAKRRAEFVKGDPKRGLLSPATVNRTTTQLLRRILTRAKLVWKEQLPAEPHWRAHMLKEAKGLVRELRYDEEEKLEAVERDDYRAPRLFAQLTGLRRREVAGLTWSQIDLDGGTISVVGKGDKPHVLPITDELRDLLAPQQGHHPEAVFTFVAQKNRLCPRTKTRYVKGQRYPVTYEGLGTHFQRTVKKAGIKGLRIHDLRHTAATRTLRATGNLRLVQQMLAHSSPTTTAKYAHASLDDMREGMTKAGAASTKRRIEVSGKVVSVGPPSASVLIAAIAAHREVLDAIRAAPPFDGDSPEAVGLDDAEDAALRAVLAAPCESREDAAALLKHLRPYVTARGSAFGATIRDDGELACEVAEAVLGALAVTLGEQRQGQGSSASSPPASEPHCLV